MSTPEQELRSIMNALGESIVNASDDEIMADVREEGLDPQLEAEQIRRTLHAADGMDKSEKTGPGEWIQSHPTSWEEETYRLAKICALMEFNLKEKTIELDRLQSQDFTAEIAKLKAIILRLAGMILTAERKNTDAWMQHLVQMINQACTDIRDESRFIYDRHKGVISHAEKKR